MSAMGTQGPAIVATDYIRASPEQLRANVPMRYTVLGTDGFGRSDTRAKDVAKSIELYEIDQTKPFPLSV